MPHSRLAIVAAALLVLGCAGGGSTVSALPDVAEATASRPLAEARDRWIEEGDLRLRYRDVGRLEGEAIVLLHGFSRSLDDWFGIGDSLATDRRVIALDQRGFGRSTRYADPQRYGWEMVNDVVRLLDRTGVRRAHLVGHSMGALVAAGVLARHPSRVASATLISGMYADSATTAARLAPWLAGLERGTAVPMVRALFPGTPDSVAQAISRSMFATNDTAALVATMRNGPPAIMPSQIAAANVPVLAVVGSNDALAAESRALSRAAPAVRLLVVEGANHLSVGQHSETLNAIRELTARASTP